MSKKLPDPTTGAFLNTARQYHEAARKLFPQRKSVELPLYFLYGHTIELLLKAFLRAHGLPMQHSHDLGFFLEKCRQNGLRVHTDLQNVVNLLESENQNQGFRYYLFASTTKPEISYVSEIVDDLLKVVSDYVKNNPEIVPKKTIVKLTLSKPMPKDAMRFPPSNL